MIAANAENAAVPAVGNPAPVAGQQVASGSERKSDGILEKTISSGYREFTGVGVEPADLGRPGFARPKQ
jgi:hypothetical protein